MKTLPLEKAFQLMEPGPVVLVSTAHKGKANLMTMSWHMVVDFTPRIACVIGPWDHTHTALCKTGECVIAIPTVDLATQVVKIGNCSGKDIDKFKTFGLTPLPAKRVQAPLVAECLANIECRVEDARSLKKHSIVILRAVRAWIDPRRRERRTFHAHGDGTFSVDGRTLDLKKWMVKW